MHVQNMRTHRLIPAVAYSICMHYSSHSHALNDKIFYFCFVLFIFVFMISYVNDYQN